MIIIIAKQIKRLLAVLLVLTMLGPCTAVFADPAGEDAEAPTATGEDISASLYDEKAFLGHMIRKMTKSRDGSKDIYLREFGKNHIVVPETITKDTKLIIFGSCPSTAKWYAVNRDAVAVVVTPTMESHLSLGTSQLVGELIEAMGSEKVLWFGFSAAGRSVMDSLGCFLAAYPEADPQVLILADPEVGNQLNFTCIDSKFCTGDDRIELYKKNGTRFLCLAKDDRLLVRSGVRKLIESCEVTCMISPYKEHSGTAKSIHGIVWNAVERGIIEYSLGMQEKFDVEYEVLDTAAPPE